MKKLLVTILVVVFLLSGSFTGAAFSKDIAVYIDNSALYLEDLPIIKEGRTLAPMRGLFEALGADVDWEEETRTAVGVRDGINVRIAIDSVTPTVNGEVRNITVPAQLINDRTYIPLRFVGEAFGDDVSWDGATRSINIVSANNQDISDEEITEEEMTDEEMIYDNVNINISADKVLLPAGGGQEVEITVKVTQDNQLAAVNTPVEIFANAIIDHNSYDRSSQTSDAKIMTDASGIVRVTYTTKASDDDAQIFIQATVPEADNWTEQGITLMASNTAALVQGKLIHPFTGIPIQGADIGFDSETGSHHFYQKATNADGSYTVAVPPGDYHVGYEFDLGDTAYYSGSFRGSHSNFNDDNTASIRIKHNIASGQEYTLDSERGILKGARPSMGAGDEIYITLRGTNNTVIAEINSDGRFLIALPAGTYEIGTRSGTVLKQNQVIEKGKVADVGTF